MPEDHAGKARLDSWKDIASYLNRDVRTVIRWERGKASPSTAYLEVSGTLSLPTGRNWRRG